MIASGCANPHTALPRRACLSGIVCGIALHCLQGPLYPTHALFEASRSGHLEMLALLLSDPLLDVNARAVRLFQHRYSWIGFVVL